jgi:hypothetical protein
MGEVRAQENFPLGPENYEQDAQMFAPFELDLDNLTDKQWSGYFFEYNKLIWSHDERTVGSNVSETISFFNGVQTKHHGANGNSEIIYRVNPQDVVAWTNNPLPAPIVITTPSKMRGRVRVCLRQSLRAAIAIKVTVGQLAY